MSTPVVPYLAGAAAVIGANAAAPATTLCCIDPPSPGIAGTAADAADAPTTNSAATRVATRIQEENVGFFIGSFCSTSGDLGRPGLGCSAALAEVGWDLHSSPQTRLAA